MGVLGVGGETDKMKKLILSLAAVSLLFCSSVQAADTFNLVIMASKNPKVEGPKYAVLSKYIQSRMKGFPSIRLKIAKDYPDAVNLFRLGEADGMFSGSFVAAMFIRKGVAKPVARPLLDSGASTYKALVAAKKGAAAFKGLSTFKGKKVAYTALASSGEIFVRSLLGKGETPEDYFSPLIVKSHQIALNAVSSGAANYAVFKNLVWDPNRYPDLEIIGGDVAENPNNTLILTNAAYDRFGKGLMDELTGLGNDKSPLAMEVKKAFKAKTFIKTTESDFRHTYDNIKKAHINPETFDFSF